MSHDNSKKYIVPLVRQLHKVGISKINQTILEGKKTPHFCSDPVEAFIWKLCIRENPTYDLILVDDIFAKKVVTILELLEHQKTLYPRGSRTLGNAALHVKRYIKFIQENEDFENFSFLESFINQTLLLPAPHPAKPFSLAEERETITRKNFITGIQAIFRRQSITRNVALKSSAKETKAFFQERYGQKIMLGRVREKTMITVTVGTDVKPLPHYLESVRIVNKLIRDNIISALPTEGLFALTIRLIEVFFGINYDRMYFVGIKSDRKFGRIDEEVITVFNGDWAFSDMSRLTHSQQVVWILPREIMFLICELMKRKPNCDSFKAIHQEIKRKPKNSFSKTYKDEIEYVLKHKFENSDFGLTGANRCFRHIATALLDIPPVQLAFYSGTITGITRGELPYLSRTHHELQADLDLIHNKIRELAEEK